MLVFDDMVDTVRDLWGRHLSERPRLDRVFGYATGVLGAPEVPDGASDEIKEIARLSVKNVLSLVEDSFAQNLSVVGFRSAEATVNLSGWGRWQAQRMDARQSDVHRPALRYGASYLVVAPDATGGPVRWRPRTPRQVFAVYEDVQLDMWPLFALETWVDDSTGKPRRKGLLLDPETAYPLDLGEASKWAAGSAARRVPVELDGEPWDHGGTGDDGEPVVPVVRYVGTRRGETAVVGEVEPLIGEQKSINAVNFDRLVVSRFGAFPQKYVMGWTANASAVLKASMSRVWTFEDEQVKAGAFPAASVAQYNELLREMEQHVAMRAQVPPQQVTGDLTNIGPEALAATEKGQQRKLAEMRQSLGESHEQAFRLDARMSGDAGTAMDRSAEVVWADTEARSFGAVVDGITKLASAGVPIDEMLGLVPGLSQQQITSIRTRVAGSSDIVAALRELSAQPAAL